MKKIHIKYENRNETICGKDINKVLTGSTVSDIPKDRMCLVCAQLSGYFFYTDDDTFYEALRKKEKKRTDYKNFEKLIISKCLKSSV